MQSMISLWTWLTAAALILSRSAAHRQLVSEKLPSSGRSLLEDVEYTILAVTTRFLEVDDSNDVTGDALISMCDHIKKHLIYIEDSLKNTHLECVNAMNGVPVRVDTVMKVRINSDVKIQMMNDDFGLMLEHDMQNDEVIMHLGKFEPISVEATKVWGWLPPEDGGEDVDSESDGDDGGNDEEEQNDGQQDGEDEHSGDEEQHLSDEHERPGEEEHSEQEQSGDDQESGSDENEPTNDELQDYAFKMPPVNSMSAENMDWCPGLKQADFEPVDEKLQFLFLLGAQKSGTSWLHNALMGHPLFVEADDAYLYALLSAQNLGGGWNKEVRFFHTSPPGTTQEYIDCFPKDKVDEAKKGTPTVFLDSTPDYLPAPTAAPRIKQAVPNAKFIIVLRDAVGRTVSAHNMKVHSQGKCFGNTCVKEYGPLLEEIRAARSMDVTWPENLDGCNFNEWVPEVKDRKTWGECWRCQHFVYSCDKLSDDEITAIGECEPNRIPHVPEVPFLQYGLYAAQISWWLAFFPPERFLILTQEEIQDPKRALPVLNKILDFAGHFNAERFKEKAVSEVKGFFTQYSGDMTEDDQLAIEEVKEYFDQPNRDLKNLLNHYYPEMNFDGLRPEYESGDSGKDKGVDQDETGHSEGGESGADEPQNSDAGDGEEQEDASEQGKYEDDKQAKKDIAPSDLKKEYAFKVNEPNSMTFDDMEWCPNTRVPDIKPVDDRLQFLFLLGVQKSGTTWLHNALTTHPLFVDAERAFGGGWAKELHFFQNQPLHSIQRFVDCFPQDDVQKALEGEPRVFLDSTPDNMPTPAAAPRIQKAMPNAKFVIVLRDPVARTVSAHNMKHHANGKCWGTEDQQTCVRRMPELLDEFMKNRDQTFDWPEDISGCNFNSTDVAPEDRKSFGECYRCFLATRWCDELTDEEKDAFGGCEVHKVPHIPQLPVLQYGLYAAQLSWWLSFFPPERFMILRQEDTKDPEKALEIVNNILDFLGHEDAERFTSEVVGGIEGFNTPYTHFSEQKKKAIREIGDFFVQPNKDLQNLMDTFFPDHKWQGLKEEYADLK